jgi:septal ring factor EnvC (AmiA/AmiB activator)
MDDFAKLEQTCTLRGQLGTLLIQTLQAEGTITQRIAELENEIRQQRIQLDQTAPAIRSLRETISSVDDAIRRQRDQIYGGTKPAQSAVETKPAETARAPHVDAGQKQRPRR